jgi:hypothetical protein
LEWGDGGLKRPIPQIDGMVFRADASGIASKKLTISQPAVGPDPEVLGLASARRLTPAAL